MRISTILKQVARTYIVAIAEEVEEFVVRILEIWNAIIVIVGVDVIGNPITVRVLRAGNEKCPNK